MKPPSVVQDALTSEQSGLRTKRILVPLDFSRASMGALKYAISVAEEIGAAIDLVHVRPADDLASVPGAGSILLNCADAVALVRERFTEIRAEHPVTFLPENCHVVSGQPYEKICQLARELRADLIVMPTRGHSGFKRMVLGSTAERIVRQAPCPVLIPRGAKFDRIIASGESAERFSLRRILVPIDFSDCSLVGLKYAVSLAKRFKARLRMVHVVFPSWQMFQMDRMGDDLAAWADAARGGAEKEMGQLKQLKLLHDVTCETEIRVGSPVEEICAESAKQDVDLIVTSTHGRTGLRHAMVGSVAEHIMRYAEIPVLIVPSQTSDEHISHKACHGCCARRPSGSV